MRAIGSPVSALLLSAVMVGLTGCSHAQATRTGAESFATVNGKSITQAEYDRFVTVKLGDFSKEKLSDTVRSALLDELLKREVALQAAQAEGLLAESVPLQTSEADCVVLAEQENDLLVQKYYQEVILKDIKVTHDEVEAYYNQHREAYAATNGFYVRELRAPTRTEAERLREQVVSGQVKFVDVARNVGTGSGENAPTYYDANAVPQFLKDAVTPLHDGEMSDIVKSNFGYHVFLLERRETPSVEQVQERVARDLLSRKNEERVETTVNRLLDSARVSIHHERLPFHYEGRFAQQKQP